MNPPNDLIAIENQFAGGPEPSVWHPHGKRLLPNGPGRQATAPTQRPAPDITGAAGG